MPNWPFLAYINNGGSVATDISLVPFARTMSFIVLSYLSTYKKDDGSLYPQLSPPTISITFLSLFCLFPTSQVLFLSRRLDDRSFPTYHSLNAP